MKTTSLTPSIVKSIKIPRRNDERVILHFDYDCFYASVFENENPSLKSQPLGIKQKSILATCNYVARARGVKKLMLISEAQRICPDLILMNGEDLTRFRDVSKKLWAFLRAHSWNHRVERLGLDEVFLDVTDVVAYNQETLNVHALRDSFFHLDRSDPVKGFAFDGSGFSGCVAPSSTKAKGAVEVDIDNPLCVRLMLASHLAGYLRHKLDEDFGYTSSSGISTSKLLAKLAGSVNKPNNQTTLLATKDDDDAVRTFMDGHSIRKIPGIGSRIAQLIEEYLLSRPTERRDRESTNVMVGEARTHPGMSPDLLEQILDRPGAERGSGEKVWNFLHGVDPSEVKEASDVPTQISIEDTYMSRPLQTPAEVVRELHALATSLIRRMRVDLTEVDLTAATQKATPTALDPRPPSNAPRWLAYPKTLRLSTRTKPKQTVPSSSTNPTAAEVPNFSPGRASRDRIRAPALPPSAPGARRRVEPGAAEYLRDEHGRGRQRGRGRGGGAGRDIGRMFRTQEDKLREWTVYDSSPLPAPVVHSSDDGVGEYVADEDMQKDIVTVQEEDMHGELTANSSAPLVDDGDDEVDDEIWDGQDESDSQLCQICGHVLPAFAISAHERFHAMDE
ncbi:hypothetical protein CIB48_g9086 [Xylaria polymorpha]|nr:hypothetical protein CIB48_g9086 [Xylaria polymorpha]